MEDVFFKTSDRSFGFAFHGNRLDRLSERREDAAFLAELRRHPGARVVLIARDMPILSRGEPREAFFADEPDRNSRRSAARNPARRRRLGRAGLRRLAAG